MALNDFLAKSSANMSSDTLGAIVITVVLLIKKIMELKDNYSLFRDMLNVMHSHLMEMHSSSSQYHTQVSPAVERCTKLLIEARIQFSEDLPSLRGRLTLHCKMEEVKMKFEAGFKELVLILTTQDPISKTALLQPPKPLMRSSITHSNLLAVQTYDPVKEDLQKIGKLSTDDGITQSNLQAIQLYDPVKEDSQKIGKLSTDDGITQSNLQAVQIYDPVKEDLQKIGKLSTDDGITQSNLQPVQIYDPVKEDLQKIGKLFTDIYDTFKVTATEVKGFTRVPLKLWAVLT